MSRRVPACLLALLCAAVVSGCGGAAASTPSASPAAAGPVARVGSEEISRAQFDLRMRSVAATIGAAGGPSGSSGSAMQHQVEARVMQSLIIDSVISQEAAVRHLSATDADVAAGIAADAAAVGGEAQLETQVAEAGGSLDQLRDGLRAQINEQRVEDFFASQRAAALLQSLKGGADFAAVARQQSDDTVSAPQGGDRGAAVTAELRTSDPALASALSSLAPGQLVATAVRDNAGYEILRLDGRTASTLTYHRLLVAAPQPYTVKERPTWFAAGLDQAIAQYCGLGRLTVLLPELPQPCVAPSPASSASSTASGSAAATATP